MANDLNNETDKAYYENMLIDQAFRSQTDELKVALKLESSHYNAQRFGQTASLNKGGGSRFKNRALNERPIAHNQNTRWLRHATLKKELTYQLKSKI